MKVKQLLGRALLTGLTVGCTGCATSGQQSWMPSWLGGTSATSSIGANASNTTGKGMLGSPAQQPTGLAGVWQSATKNLTSAVTPASNQEPDAVSLDRKPGKIGPEVYLSAARIHEQRGDVAGALEQYHKALLANPKDPTAQIGMGRLHDKQGEFAKAVHCYQQAIQIDPKSALPHNDLGLCYARQGDPTKSIAELQQAVRLQPESKLYRNNLATVLVEAGRDQEALQQLAAAHTPAAAHYNLGVLLARHGKTDLAGQHLQQALSIDPNLSVAQQALAALQQPSSPSDAAPQVAAADGNKWQGLATSQGALYPTGTTNVAETVPAERGPPTTATPYAPGSIFHVGDEELSPTLMGQRQSKKNGVTFDRLPATEAVSAFSRGSSRRYLNGANDRQRESVEPQTLELSNEIVSAKAPVTLSLSDESDADEAVAPELMPVSAELEIDAP